MGEVVSLGLERKIFIFVVPIRSHLDTKGAPSLPRFFPLNYHIDRNTSLSKGNGSRGRDRIHHLWPSIGPFPVDKIPEALG